SPAPSAPSQALNESPRYAGLDPGFGWNRTRVSASAANSRALAEDTPTIGFHVPAGKVVLYSQVPLTMSTPVTAMPRRAPASRTESWPVAGSISKPPPLVSAVKANVTASPSTSVAVRGAPTVVPFGVSRARVKADPGATSTGASLTALTVIETVAVLLSAVPS